jgi:hypothetical protein
MDANTTNFLEEGTAEKIKQQLPLFWSAQGRLQPPALA